MPSADPETNANRGYAFLNFIDPSFAWMCARPATRRGKTSMPTLSLFSLPQQLPLRLLLPLPLLPPQPLLPLLLLLLLTWRKRILAPPIHSCSCYHRCCCSCWQKRFFAHPQGSRSPTRDGRWAASTRTRHRYYIIAYYVHCINHEDSKALDNAVSPSLKPSEARCACERECFCNAEAWASRTCTVYSVSSLS